MASDGTIISIHSLVKRETGLKICYNGGRMDFNPLPRKEGDGDQKRFPDLESKFQSTPS